MAQSDSKEAVLDFEDFLDPDRGACLAALWLDFVTEGNCLHAFEQLGADFDADGRWAASFFALTGTPGVGQPYLVCQAHAHGEEHGGTHWQLGVHLMPDANPPADYITSTEKVGVYPDVLKQLTSLIPAETRTSSSRLLAVAGYHLSPTRWAREVCGWRAESQRPFLGGRLEWDQTSWNLEPPQGNISRLVISSSEAGLFVSAEASPELVFDASILTSADAAIWTDLEPLLQSAE